MAILGTFSTLSLIILLYILARLSHRFGSVIKMQPLYRYYYVALGLVGISFIAHVIAALGVLLPQDTPRWFSAPEFFLWAYHLPLTVGLTLGLYITWRYWSWLVTERNE